MTEQKSSGIGRHVDAASQLVIALTLVLFAAALIVKGIGHDVLLEAGVFLVSVKLIVMAYKARLANDRIIQELASLRDEVARLRRDSPSQR